MKSSTSATLLTRLRRQRALFPRYGIKKLEIFGSVARGEAKANSDIDLIATYRRSPSLLQVVSFQQDLEKRLGRPVDLLDAQAVRDMTNPYRLASINASRTVIYEA